MRDWKTEQREQASDFAAAILMPEKAFRKAVEDIGPNITLLARHFKVTGGAVIRRAAMLRLEGFPQRDRYDP